LAPTDIHICVLQADEIGSCVGSQHEWGDVTSLGS